MLKQLYKIKPYFEHRMWGGSRILENFNYKTDLYPIGEVYNVVALPNEADCEVEGLDMTLSELYHNYPHLFECDTEQLPIRVNLLDPLADLSVQLHPDDAYALKHNNSRGKPEAWVILDCPEDGYIQFGHHAKDKAQFKKLSEDRNWEKLLKYLPAKKDHFIDIPAGTLHAIGKDVLTYNISRNTDLTYRLYDYDRVDPNTNELRPLHIEQVFDNILAPDESIGFVKYEAYKDEGCTITDYWNEPGLYNLSRIQVEEFGKYNLSRFAFLTIVDGEGMINDMHVIKGETVLVPHDFNTIEIKGNIDLFVASYDNVEK